MIKAICPNHVVVLVPALICLLAAGLSAANLPAGAEFIIQSHRGAGNLAPENTLPTFQLAWKMGTVPEADVRATTDGVIVAFHDNNLKRLAPGAPEDIKAKSVNDLSWAVASSLDVGEYKGTKYKGERMARIDEVFDEMKGRPERWLYLDVKEVPLEKMAKMAYQRGIQNQLILASTHYEHHQAWKKMLPTSQTLLWMGGEESALRKRIDDLRKADFACLTQLQVHIVVGDLNSADPFSPSSAFIREVAKELKSRGILFQTWVRGSDDPRAYEMLLDLGLDSFASDDPHVALEVMRNYHKRTKK
ncbi:MAG: glycerophosphodiester phosphodiesterase family protein [Armatimonadetes bacterium]|jgi:glycerophosphoryl diester phosphodiesterase|nr:glycerophosphodiester phosphodiesterase family protein [Armatimonadota bacterium]